MLDYVIRNGTVVDGTGAPGFRADVGIKDGMIVAVGTVDDSGATELDAEGLVVAPGIIDPHTHYDAQLFWDPTASPSNLHGVTTVIAGNCGFTLAPIKAEDHDYIRRMMAKVEGMPLVALEDGIEWDWSSFGEYLDRLEGNLGVNAGFLVGHCALFLIPGWGDVMGLPTEARIEKLRDPAVRAELDELAHSEGAGVFRRLSSWANYIVGDTFALENAGYSWRDVGSIAEEQGKEPFDALLDLVIADDLRTVLWPKASDGDAASWQARVDVWNDPGALVGGSDAGAHLDRMCGSNYPTSFLGDCLRKRKLVPMEQAVHWMTQAPADLFGLHDRGRVAEGLRADLFVFDPETVASEPATLVEDLPGGSPRLIADSIGVTRVLVNGVETVVDGQPTGNLPGTLLRSGRDTVTVDTTAGS